MEEMGEIGEEETLGRDLIVDNTVVEDNSK